MEIWNEERMNAGRADSDSCFEFLPSCVPYLFFKSGMPSRSPYACGAASAAAKAAV